jgi:hypothetical protein
MVKRKRLTASQWEAHDRRLVRLPDGRLGRLQYVTPNSRVATVVVAGRRVRLPYGELELVKGGDVETFRTVATQ